MKLTKSLSANPTKSPNTFKQTVGFLPTNCLNVFGDFVGLALKGLRLILYMLLNIRKSDSRIYPLKNLVFFTFVMILPVGRYLFEVNNKDTARTFFMFKCLHFRFWIGIILWLAVHYMSLIAFHLFTKVNNRNMVFLLLTLNTFHTFF